MTTATKSKPRGRADADIDEVAPTPPPAPFVVNPHAVYSKGELQRLLGLRSSTLRREIREGRLRVSKRAGRYFFLGSWVVEWITSGEVH